jgi:glycerol-3-phosphate dehydrogenase
MWDDVMVIEVLRSAAESQAAIANYVEAVEPIWKGEGSKRRICGFRVHDVLGKSDFEVHAHRTVVCAGPWTDDVGQRLSREWKNWLSPSKGVHLIFDLKRIPIQGAMVMSHPVDGRIAFVIPRPDFGSGVVIVGTTDGPSPADPGQASVQPQDVDYLLDLLQRYFPDLKLGVSDILSAYVGVRPLMGGDKSAADQLQKVSREHYIGEGPGGTTLVAGGKYTTYRKIAEEVVDFALKHWREDVEKTREREDLPPNSLMPARTREAMNPFATPAAVAQAKARGAAEGLDLPPELLERYGANALMIREWARKEPAPSLPWPEGFPDLSAQLRYSIRYEMTIHLTDFYFRRHPLFASRADHGLPWAEELSRVWAQEMGADESARAQELELLRGEVASHLAWLKQMQSS